MEKFDLFVLGTGPAGQRAAVQAAKLGKKVGICEKREVVGGVCINTGTIPSKTFREAVLYLSGFAQRGMYGASYSVKENITAEDLLFRCTAVIKREIEVIRAQMRRNGVTLITGAAKFTSPHTLTVTGLKAATEVEADKIVIATGTRPATPPGVAVDGETILDSDGILGLKVLPRTMIVVGAGVIGVEYASMFAALGVRGDARRQAAAPPRLRGRRDRRSALVRNAQHELHAAPRRGRRRRPRRGPAPRGRDLLKSGKRIVADLLLYSIGRIGATAELESPRRRPRGRRHAGGSP